MFKQMNRCAPRLLLVVLGCVAFTFGGEPSQKIRAADPSAQPADVGDVDSSGLPGGSAELRRVAPDRGHYQTLLRTIEVPKDQETYGDFCDFGYWEGTEYAGQRDLPKGYWVYLSPKWYIFKDASHSAVPTRTPRPWGPEQATGKPDTWPQSGDIQTAWASLMPNGQTEWLDLTYAQAMRPTAILIYETNAPGAVNRITTFDEKGAEVELWSGTDPTPTNIAKGISVISLRPDFDLKRVRIYLDSLKVPGWNEIDAVGLLDEAGETHWATGATASSTYADRVVQPGGLSPLIDEAIPVPELRLR